MKTIRVAQFCAFISLAAAGAFFLATEYPLALVPYMVAWGEFYKWSAS